MRRATDTRVTALNHANPCAGPFGGVYDFYIERERLARIVGSLVWGVDNSLLYRSLAAIRSAPDGATILDVPCGGGVAFRALEPSQRVRYLAFDIDETMLARAQRRADSLGLAQVELGRADAAALPLVQASADLCFCHGGLHCFPQPEAALGELVRCLRPGGRLIGTTFISPGTRRQRFLFGGERRRSGLPPLWTEERLLCSLTDAGLIGVAISASAGLALFQCLKPSAPLRVSTSAEREPLAA